jgi:SAM-dependent methyltransferase
MFFGTNENFQYMNCYVCGCLQIIKIPNDLHKYYPEKYRDSKNKDSRIKLLLKSERNQYLILKKSIMGKLINIKYPNKLYELIGKTNLNTESRILDWGCGDGSLLTDFKYMGFKELLGVDPYVKSRKIQNLKILNKSITDLPDNIKFDLIISTHSFEHIYNQLESLKKISSILSKNGNLILSMPIKNDYIWNLYGRNWVQIDAPRHLFIHTLDSFRILLKNSNLKIKDVIFNSNEFFLWGSEQIKNGIYLNADNSYLKNPKKSIFCTNEIKSFKVEAENLNNKKLGDQAIFYIELDK